MLVSSTFSPPAHVALCHVLWDHSGFFPRSARATPAQRPRADGRQDARFTSLHAAEHYTLACLTDEPPEEGWGVMPGFGQDMEFDEGHAGRKPLWQQLYEAEQGMGVSNSVDNAASAAAAAAGRHVPPPSEDATIANTDSDRGVDRHPSYPYGRSGAAAARARSGKPLAGARSHLARSDAHRIGIGRGRWPELGLAAGLARPTEVEEPRRPVVSGCSRLS